MKKTYKRISAFIVVGAVIMTLGSLVSHVIALVLEKCTRYLQLSIIFENIADYSLMISCFVLLTVLLVDGFKNFFNK